MGPTAWFYVALVLFLIGVFVGWYLKTTERKSALKKAYDDGVAAGRSQPKPTPKKMYTKRDVEKAERKGYDRGYAEAGAELEEAIETKMSDEAERLISQGFEAGIAFAQGKGEDV